MEFIMDINPFYFSFPPYISTSWEHIIAINMKEGDLEVHLSTGEILIVPNPSKEEEDLIFKAHLAYLESEAALNFQLPAAQQNLQSKGGNAAELSASDEATIRFGFGAFDGFGSALQHNPSQMNAPDLPVEILDKIMKITKIIAPENPQILPKPELHCNCFYCQVARAAQEGLSPQEDKPIQLIEEQVSEDDLQFQQWDILETSDKLYTVTNRLDTKEMYNVFLGNPVGCTCGKPACEHILAVLKS